MKKRVLACILAAALLTTGIPGGQAAMAQSLTENGTEMATEEVNPENTSEETEAASVTETEVQTSTEREDVYKRQSQEMANRNLSNQEYVTMLYRTMMDREPDEAGLNDWVTRLQSGTSRQSVFDGFADSTEFDNIVRAYGLK